MVPLADLTVTPSDLTIGWTLHASAASVWAHLADRDKLPQWLGKVVEGDLSPGGTIVVDHGEDYLCTSIVADMVPEQRLAMSWEFPDEQESALTLELTQLGAADEILLTLAHRSLGELTTSYVPGWLAHLTYLEASLAGHPLPRLEFWNLTATLTALYAHGGPEASGPR